MFRLVPWAEKETNVTKLSAFDTDIIISRIRSNLMVFEFIYQYLQKYTE